MLYLIIIGYMSYLLEQFEFYRDRIRLGSLTIAPADYPFASFLIGYLVSKHNLQIEHLFEFLELLYRRQKEGQLTQEEFKGMVRLIEDFPRDIRKLTGILSDIRNGKKPKINKLIESYYRYENMPSSQKSQNKVQPSSPLTPPLSPAAVANDGTQELGNDGTQQLGNNGTQQLGGTLQLDGVDFSSHTEQLEPMKEERKKMEEADIELARRMQEEFNKQPNKQEDNQIPCQICYSNLYDDDFLPLDQCGHLFHKNCLSETFKTNILSNNFPLRCPNDECKAEVSQADIKGILDKDQFQKYQSNTLKSYADLNGDSISWCPTANCNYMFFYEKDDNERFECYECKKEYCLNCRVDWHKDMTCKEYKISSTTSEDDKLFMDFVKGKKFKQCPKCKFWVEKNEGCDHMTCKCKFEFCYKCGGVYMKCECVAKMQAEIEQRRQRQQQQRRKKLQRKQKAATKAEKKALPPPPPTSTRSRRRN